MKKLNKTLIKELADSLMIKISEEELELILKDESFYQLLEFMECVDTSDVAMMHMPFEEETSYLRDDVVTHVLNREIVMKNAPIHDGEFIEVVQVINK